jgi:hypothetical protein
VAILSERPRISSPDLSRCTDSGEVVTNDESDVFEISSDEIYDESAFPEAPEPISEPVSKLEPELEPPQDDIDFTAEAVAEHIDDDWGGSTPVRSTKKTKKGKRAL